MCGSSRLGSCNWLVTLPGKSWVAILRMHGPGQAWIDKLRRPGEITRVVESD